MLDFESLINKASIIYGEDANLELIAKYSGDIMVIAENEDVIIEVLNSSFAIITLPFSKLRDVLSYTQINYVEVPKKLIIVETKNSFLDEFYKEPYICPLPENTYTGKGVMVAILDTGIAYQHADFRYDDGTSRILYLWDQSVNGTPPNGFYQGNLYTKKDIDNALLLGTPLGSTDNVGHGTLVAGIAVGNGRESNGVYKGVAPDANILVVKLGKQESESFAMVTEFMRAIKFAYEMAIKEDMPLVINVSYGTNDGSHNGDTLFEEYINDMATTYKANIVISTGNEGNAGHHYESTIMDNETENIDFTIAPGVQNLYMSLWKNFSDDMTVELITPDNQSTGKISMSNIVRKFEFEGITIRVLYNLPSPYKLIQEIFFQIDYTNLNTVSSDWTLIVQGTKIVDGNFKIWLPTTEEVTLETYFKYPSINTTLMIPSTASSVISVAGYDTKTNEIADFSGRGLTANEQIKPDISAPAIDILTTNNLLTYGVTTGTSFSAPFVTGACAVLMDYGITNKNEIFLYGEKMKAYLQKGAKRLEENVYPNKNFGYGTLCIQNTIDILRSLNSQQVLIKKEDNIENLDIVKEFDDFVIANVSSNYLDNLEVSANMEKPLLLSPTSESKKTVLIGLIDSEFDIENECFNKSKIKYYYDLQSEIKDPIVNQSENSKIKSNQYFHGNEVAKTINNITDNVNYICVKLPKANKQLLNFNHIKDDKEVFSSIDIIHAIDYIVDKAKKLNMPLVICLPFGTNMGAHNGTSIFEKYIESISNKKGVCVCASAGNEGNKKTHIERTLVNHQSETIQINVCETQNVLPVYLHTNNVDFFDLQIKSPSNEIYLFNPKKPIEKCTHTFINCKTNVIIEYNFYKQEIIIKFSNIQKNVWTIDLIPNIVDTSKLHVYLPVTQLLEENTYLLYNSSNYTVTSPATANNVISVGAYNKHDFKMDESSGRGPSTNMQIKPTVIAPSTNGTSMATAHVCALCALIFENCEDYKSINTLEMEKILKEKTNKNNIYSYPNNIEGYGKL